MFHKTVYDQTTNTWVTFVKIETSPPSMRRVSQPAYCIIANTELAAQLSQEVYLRNNNRQAQIQDEALWLSSIQIKENYGILNISCKKKTETTSIFSLS